MARLRVWIAAGQTSDLPLLGSDNCGYPLAISSNEVYFAGSPQVSVEIGLI